MTRCPSDLDLEMHLLEPARSPLAGHLAACPRCAGRLAEMNRIGEEFRREVFPATVDAVVERARGRRPLRPWLLAAVPLSAAAAAAVLLVARPPADYVGSKGSPLALSVFVQTVEGARAATDGEVVPAGAALRFQVRPRGACRLWVLSVDASGTVSRLFPATGEAGQVPGTGPLPGGAVLDGRAGPERIFAVCSATPLPFDRVAGAALAAAAGGDARVRGARAIQGLPADAAQDTLLLEKRP